MRWIVTTCVWGDAYIETFREFCLPSLLAALEYSPASETMFVVHTDDPLRLGEILKPHRHQILTIDPAEFARYHPLWGKHKIYADAVNSDLRRTPLGYCVTWPNPDCVVSKEYFAAAEKRFSYPHWQFKSDDPPGGYRLMCAEGLRVEGSPPVGVSASELNMWSWSHFHPAAKDCFWGSGTSSAPGTIYFADRGRLIAHGFSLSPVAIFKDRQPACKYGTEADLLTHYGPREIWIAPKNEVTVVTVTPADFSMKGPSIMTVESVAAWARPRVLHPHRWIFAHPVVLAGDGRDIGDRAVCAEILNQMD
jgi:hypothetical protein